jgi:ketosteroid isomerase-like protein
MKLHYKLFLLFFSFLLATNFVLAQENDVIAIKNEMNKWMKAYNKKDLNNSVAILAEDYIGFHYGHPDQTPKSIREQNEEVFKNKYLKATLSMEADEIVTSGDLAYVSIKQKWAFKPSVSTTPQIAFEKGILIFKKQNDGKWKIIRSSTFPVSAQK